MVNSVHCMSLQNSDYIVIENDMNRIRKQYLHFKSLSQDKLEKEKDMSDWSDLINLRFCHERDV